MAKILREESVKRAGAALADYLGLTPHIARPLLTAFKTTLGADFFVFGDSFAERVDRIRIGGSTKSFYESHEIARSMVDAIGGRTTSTVIDHQLAGLKDEEMRAWPILASFVQDNFPEDAVLAAELKKIAPDLSEQA